MQPFRTILHPTDFSDRTGAAFRVACALARDHGAPMATVYGGTFPGVLTDPAIYRHALEERLNQIRIPGPDAEAAPRPGGRVSAGRRGCTTAGYPGPRSWWNTG